MTSYNKHEQWVRCPECGSKGVDVWANYDREVGFNCIDCGHEQKPSLGKFVDEKVK